MSTGRDVPPGQTYRVFLSSPGDVAQERAVADRVVQSINAEYGYTVLELIRWEEDFYSATRTFQDQIVSSAECELVICIFWKHLGSELPDHYRRADGRLPTGTEYEFETAIAHSLDSENGVPDVLVYRKTAAKKYEEDNLRQQEAQRARLNAFWTRWFENEQGHFVAGFHVFQTADQFKRDLDGHLRRWIRRKAGDVSWTGGSPYRGLAAFEPSDEDVFCGRRRETQRTRARFLANAGAKQRFLLVVGPSGSGKSSLLRAGVLPQLLRTAATPEHPAFSRYAILRPAKLEQDWPRGLAEQLLTPAALGAEFGQGDFDTPAGLTQLLAGPPASVIHPLSKALERAKTRRGEDVGLILLLDQLEEIFVWDAAARDAFIELLSCLLRDANVYVIASMRSEYLHVAADHPILAKLCQFEDVTGRASPIVTLGVPSRADLRDIIAAPAQLAGLQFEPGLEARIEADADPRALPALQLLLTKLYDARTGAVLTQDAYDALGGVSGAMALQGDAVLDQVSSPVRAAFPGLVRQLVIAPQLDGTTVSRAARLQALSPPQAQLAQALIACGLFTSDGDVVRLAHEALIAGWDRMAQVVLEDQALLQARHRLSLMAAQFAQDNTMGKDGLLQGHALQEGRQLSAVWTETQVGAEEPSLPGFIARSDRVAKRRVLRWRLATAAAVIAVVGVVLTGGFLQSQVAQSRLEAELGQSTAKAAQASLGAGDRAEAVREALRARELVQSPETLSLAASVLLAADGPELVGAGSGAFVDVSFAADGRLTTLEWTGQVVLHDASGGAGETRFHLPAGPRSYVFGRVLGSGGFVALASENLMIYISPAGTVQRIPLETGPVSPESIALVARPEGFTLATRHARAGDFSSPRMQLLQCDETGNVLECATERLGPGPQKEMAGQIALSADLTHLAYTAQEGLDGPWRAVQISLMDTTQQAWEVPGRPTQLSYGPDGLYVAYTEGADVRIAPVSTSGKALDPFPDHLRFSISKAGGQLIYGCGRRVACVVRLQDGTARPVARLSRLPASFIRLAQSPDGQTSAALFSNGDLRLWDLTQTEPALRILPTGDAPVRAMAVSGAGQIAALTAQGRVVLWEAVDQPARHIVQFDEFIGGSADMTFLADGTIVIAADNKTIYRIHPDTAQITRETGWVKRRVVPLSTGGFAAIGPHELVLNDTAFPFERFVRGTVRLGGVVAGKDTVFVSATDGSLHRIDGNDIQRAVPHADSRDALAGMSLDLDPSERFLVVTRADDRVLVHDLIEGRVSATLDLPTRDSKVVAFAPGGKRLAVLTSAGALGVWAFDAGTGVATPSMFIDPVPQVLKEGRDLGRVRNAQWMDWVDANRVAISSASGDVIVLDVRGDAIEAALRRQADRYDAMTMR